ncbi:MAG: L-threonylcarbamoyladenylate synthase [Chloroflexota bacterium]|nr:L-threonylcarbamoyladenylate synthase [Chloroflexota bacterium]
MANTPEDPLKKAVRILKDGGVIAFPTDTVYGLGAAVFNLKAAERIYDIKKRSRRLPLPLLIADLSQLNSIAKPLRGIALFLAQRFWPGGLTLVLPKADSLSSYLPQSPTVAVRLPNHPICLTLIRSLGSPIIGTSANLSGNPPALSAGEVRQQLGNKVDLIIEGECFAAVESTIVDATREKPLVLRQGVVSQQKIEEAMEEYRESKNDACCLRL